MKPLEGCRGCAEWVPASKLLGADASRNRQKQRLGFGGFFFLGRAYHLQVNEQRALCQRLIQEKEVKACLPPHDHHGKWVNQAWKLESEGIGSPKPIPVAPESHYASCGVHLKPLNAFPRLAG